MGYCMMKIIHTEWCLHTGHHTQDQQDDKCRRALHRHKAIQKQKREPLSKFSFCGATGIRTRDTRIFSPLLYQLSYGTIIYA